MASTSAVTEEPPETGGGMAGKSDNSFKLSRLFLKCGRFLTRELLLRRIENADKFKSIQDFLANPEVKEKIMGLKNKRGLLNLSQINVLYPGNNVDAADMSTSTSTSASPDISTWDIPIISALLVNCFDLSSEEANVIRNIEQYRRYLYGKGAGLSIPDAEFDVKSKEISTFFQDATSRLLTSEHGLKMETLIADVFSETVTSDHEQEFQNECRQWLQNERNGDDGKTRKIKNMFKETAHALRTHIKTLEKMHIPAVTTEMTVLIGKFKNTGVLVLKGPVGTGKTYLAKSIMCEIAKGDDTDQVMLRSPVEIQRHLGVRRKLLVFVESALGHVRVDSKEVREWSDSLNSLLSLIEEGRLMLIFAIRPNVLEAIKDEALLGLFKSATSVDVTTFLDKRNALIVHAAINRVRLTEERIRALCTMEYKGVGFQLACSKLVRGTYEEVVQSFRNPVTAMQMEIHNMQAEDPILFITLMLTLLSENNLCIDRMKDDRRNFFDKVKQFWSSYSLDLAVIEKAASDLVGLYLTASGDGYSFINDTALETVFLVAIEHVQSLLMDCCPLAYIKQFSEHVESHKVSFSYLINRITGESDMEGVALLHVWDNEEFVKTIIDHVGVPYFYKLNTGQWSLVVNLSAHGHLLALKHLDSSNNILQSFSQKEIDDTHSKCLVSACGNTQFDVVEYLITCKNVRVTKEMLFKSLEGKDDPKVLSFLVDKGGDIKATRPSGENVFHVACLKGKVNIVEYIYIVCEELSEATDKRGWTALHFAAKGGSIPCFDFVNNYRKYPVDLATKKGTKAIHLAAEGPSGFLAYLVSIGVDITAKTTSGQTLLHFAALMRNVDTIWFLCEVYKDLLKENDGDNWNALHYAAKGGCVKCIQYLIDKELNPYSPTSDGRTALHVAAQSGMIEATDFLFTTFRDLYLLNDSKGRSPLHLSCLEGFIQVARLLIDYGMDPTARTFRGENLLHACIRNGSIGNVRYICENFEGMLECVDNDGNNVLHFAAMHGHPEVMDYLISCGLDPNATAKRNKTILHSAASGNNRGNVEYICKQFPDLVNCEDDRNRNVLYYAAMFGSKDMLSYLVKVGAELETISKLGITLIAGLLQGGKVENAMFICEMIDEMLHAMDDEGNGPLHYAAIANSFQFLIYLLEAKNDDPFAQNSLGKTILHLAAFHGHIEIVKHICRTYRSIMKMNDSKDWNALHDAASGGSLDCLIYLIRKGTNAGVRTSDRRTILHVAAHFGKLAVVKWTCSQYKNMLTELGNDHWSVLHDAASGSSVSCLKHLIKRGADPALRTADGKTVLHVAACFGKVEAVDYLSVKYRDLLNERDFAGNTALHYASIGGSVENFISLILENIDKHAVNMEGATALHAAAKSGSTEVVAYICRNHIEFLRLRDKYGWTALHCAAVSGSIPCVETLIKNGMNPEAVTKDGSTILALSVEHPELNAWIKTRMHANRPGCEGCVVQ